MFLALLSQKPSKNEMSALFLAILLNSKVTLRLVDHISLRRSRNVCKYLMRQPEVGSCLREVSFVTWDPLEYQASKPGWLQPLLV